MKKCQVGGQAVLEGIMMRGAKGMATAVRTPEEKIEVDFKEIVPLTKRNKILGLPIIRGFIGLIDSMIQGVKSLNYSASFFEDDDEPSKFEKWFNDKFGEKAEKIIMTITFIISFIGAITLFVALPTMLTSLFKKFGLGVISLNIIEGLIRVIILLLYMFLIGKMDDISRLYQYHGAEHKTIFCYENGSDLTVDNVKKFKRFHPRCGTNFLFLVMLVSIFVFSFTGWNSISQRIISRIILIPIVSGITYELIRWIGKSNGPIAKIVAAPGLKLQMLTTREPDDDQIEVAIVALKRAEGIKDPCKNVGELLNEGNKVLKEVKIDTYVLDTQLLLGKVLKKDKIWLITNRNIEVSEEDAKNFYDLLNKRKEKMPMQYILGSVEFMGLDFYIKEGVLIPRGDTEVLVEEILGRIEKDESLKICDLCCGSGAIGLSLAYYRENINVDLLDIAEDPEKVTNKNIKKLSLQSRTEFIKSDLFSEIKNSGELYDIVVSNPPYIKEEEIQTLMEDVKNYEPKLALSGGEDGLYFYRKIIDQSVTVLKNYGVLAFEIGYDQGEDVKNLMITNNYYDVKIIKDLAGLDRVVIGNLNLFEKK